MIATTKTSVMNGNMPIWMKFISAIGVPSAGLLYLVWFLSTSVLGAIHEHSDDHAREMRDLMSVMQQVCVNTANTPEDRLGCFPSAR